MFALPRVVLPSGALSRSFSQLVLVSRAAGAQPATLKKPKAAYFLFLSDLRKDATNKVPVVQFTKEASTLWKNLPTEKKEAYTKQYEQDKAAFRALVSGGVKVPGSAPSSPVSFFISEQLKARSAGTSVNDAMKAASQAWKGLSAEKKQVYLDRVKAAQEAHVKAVAAFKESLTPQQLSEYESYEQKKVQLRGKSPRSVYLLALKARKTAALKAWGIESDSLNVYPAYDDLSDAQKTAVAESSKLLNENMKRARTNLRKQSGLTYALH